HLYYGFAAGDQIVFGFNETTGKELAQLEIGVYNTAPSVTKRSVRWLEDEMIAVSQTAIFRFTFRNDSDAELTCNYSIYRIPKDDQSIRFNPSVVWRTDNNSELFPVLFQLIEP